jgi:hypothetical protein
MSIWFSFYLARPIPNRAERNTLRDVAGRIRSL